MDLDNIKFNGDGLVPAIAQDANTGEVLMLAYMNKEALSLTLSTKRAHYWSRSRKSLWLKGDTSGNYQDVKSILYDCDGDTILLQVEPLGPACHTGERTCFYRSLDGKLVRPTGPRVLTELYSIIKERKKALPDKSYVASLYAKGLPKILEKVAEESAELIEAAKEKGKDDIVYEFCDLLFHSMVLLSNEGIEMDEAYKELARRFGISGIEEKGTRGKK
ncbi:MAG: hypothetical protein A2X99_04450 [Deltaproteobacteria bacterium GWB2_55_19]|nr:MAG: hypothetical protein A2X99_04450 [Deltaproteobacteria bacterium GWB2_55_19]